MSSFIKLALVMVSVHSSEPLRQLQQAAFPEDYAEWGEKEWGGFFPT